MVTRHIGLKMHYGPLLAVKNRGRTVSPHSDLQKSAATADARGGRLACPEI